MSVEKPRVEVPHVAPAPGGAQPRDPSMDVYKEICASIRATDDVSLKLLAIVPLVAGFLSGALALWAGKDAAAGSAKPALNLAVLALALAGAGITLGLMRWEMRNVQKCNWLISRAADHERRLLGIAPLEDPRLGIHWDGWERPQPPLPSLFRRPWGKTQAEKLIYGTAVAVWLVPAALAIARLLGAR